MRNTRQKQINDLRAAQDADGFDARFDAVFDKMTRNSGRIATGFIVLWVIGVILGLALTGVLIWAIIAIVSALV